MPQSSEPVSALATRAPPARRRWWRGERAQYVLMFLPALLMLIGILYPFGLGVITSFTNQKLYVPETSFVGIKNYVDLFSDSLFRKSLFSTLGFVVAAITIQIPLGILVALLLDTNTPFRGFFRNTLVLPLLIPPIVAGLMWKTMMQPSAGVLNWMFQMVGLPALPWLSQPDTALASIVVIDTWVFLPFVTLILLAGLQAIPMDIMEAARVDGASEAQAFIRIKLPWLIPYILLAMLFRVPDALKTFDIIYPTTRGGPVDATRLLHVMGYQEAFQWSNISVSMTILFVLWLISYGVSGLLLVLWRNRSKVTQDA